MELLSKYAQLKAEMCKHVEHSSEWDDARYALHDLVLENPQITIPMIGKEFFKHSEKSFFDRALQAMTIMCARQLVESNYTSVAFATNYISFWVYSDDDTLTDEQVDDIWANDGWNDVPKIRFNFEFDVTLEKLESKEGRFWTQRVVMIEEEEVISK